MPLYAAARSNLSPAQQGTLDEWERAAEARGHEGANVVANLRGESHLVGDPPEPDAQALAGLMEAIVGRWPASDAREAFEAVVPAFVLDGEQLRVLPDRLYRYRTADALARAVAAANRDRPPGGPVECNEYVDDLLDRWETLGRQQVARARLGSSQHVFVTFAREDGMSVADACATGWGILSALGMPLQAEQGVVGIRYPRRPGAPLHYPTVADGGWSGDFAASGPGDRHGWTRPLDPAGSSGWPEAVHRNGDIGLLDQKPDWYEPLKGGHA